MAFSETLCDLETAIDATSSPRTTSGPIVAQTPRGRSAIS
jgi:hypothetical protein